MRRFATRWRAGWSAAPDDDAAEMYLEGLARLDRAGFEQYEISNVARAAQPVASQLGAVEGSGLDLAAARAPSAASGGAPARADYINRVTAGADVRLDRRALGATEQLEEALFMGLRLNEGLDLIRMNRNHGIDIWERYGQDLAPYVSAGLLIHEPGRRLALTRNGMLLANDVMTVVIGGTVR
jgi:oxygen-independent coproporphyrinogen-3 oxidase